MALSPFAAIRASDLLAAELLENSHPVAVARRLLPEEDFRNLAGAELRKVRYSHGDLFLARVFEEFLARHAVDRSRCCGHRSGKACRRKRIARFV